MLYLDIYEALSGYHFGLTIIGYIRIFKYINITHRCVFLTQMNPYEITMYSK